MFTHITRVVTHVSFLLTMHILPPQKDYIHRVGRTARAGRSGKAITIVTQYDVELFQRIEEVRDARQREWRDGDRAMEKEPER